MASPRSMMGYDPDESSPAEMSDLLAFEQEWGDDAIEDIAAAAKGRTVETIRTLMSEARPYAAAATVPDAVLIRVKDGLLGRDEHPWRAGYTLAKLARRQYGLDHGPIGTERLSEIFDVFADRITHHPTASPCGAIFRGHPDADELSIVLSARSARSRRFEFVRLVGGHLADWSGDRLIAATRAKTARQKMQRAFAAEFLCPVEGLREMLGGQPADEDFIDEAAERYDVSSELVRRMIHNGGLDAAPEIARGLPVRSPEALDLYDV